ncbi:MAG: isochorismate synthase [Chloroflexi bacterium]|nr:isochorismate synthase [Chloroflexota bacterium]
MSADRLISYSQRAPDISIAEFLRQAQGHERFYWEKDDLAFAGFGIATELTAWGAERVKTIEDKARKLFRDALVISDAEPLAKPRLFGGFSFYSDFVTENTWAAFAPAYFVLPHYQLVKRGADTWLTINVQIGADESYDEAELCDALSARYDALLHADQPTNAGQPELLSVNYPLSFERWSAIITDATTRMRAGEMQKVVLSRVCEARFAERINIDGALAYLNEKYADCYRFLFEPSPGLAFYGATPELLIGVDGADMATMGLAGTIKRGQTPEEDDALALRLLTDPKEAYEHRVVVDALRERLTPITSALSVPNAPIPLKLSNLQHLYTPISGRLRAASGVLPLVERLHPTPALGGVPRERAMQYIREAEPVPRGWYAAPIGWIDHNLDGMFAVAIRSAVVQNDRAWLYSGAGIVAESTPQREWDETALKFRPMLNALGIGTAQPHPPTPSPGGDGAVNSANRGEAQPTTEVNHVRA